VCVNVKGTSTSHHKQQQQQHVSLQAEIKKEEERELLRPPSGKSVGTKITLLAPEEKKTGMEREIMAGGRGKGGSTHTGAPP